MTIETSQPRRSPTELLAALQDAYRAVTGRSRSLELDDRLSDDLALDSVDCLNILALVDDQLELGAFDEIVDGDADLVLVRDVVTALQRRRGAGR
jgi:acyl carrier protein